MTDIDRLAELHAHKWSECSDLLWQELPSLLAELRTLRHQCVEVKLERDIAKSQEIGLRAIIGRLEYKRAASEKVIVEIMSVITESVEHSHDHAVLMEIA